VEQGQLQTASLQNQGHDREEQGSANGKEFKWFSGFSASR